MYKLKNLVQRYPLIFITTILLFSGILIFSLLQLAPLPNSQKNGFSRRLLTESLRPTKTINLELPLEQFCGATPYHAFFSVPNPSWLIVVNEDLTKLDTLKFSVPNIKQVIGANNLQVDSPFVYFFANNLSSVFKGEIGQAKMDSIQLQILGFTRSTNISNGFAVIRSLTPSLEKQLFQKIDLRNGTIVKSEEITVQSGVGGFDSDGMLKYDPVSESIFYVEYNRNRFYCLDTSLRQRYMGHTIDTVSVNTGQVQRVQLRTEDKLMPVKPRINVNIQSCSGNGFLFIVSALKADNERNEIFMKNAVIDLYDIAQGNYQGSIYIPLINKQKIKSMSVWNNQLIVLYNKQLCTFPLENLPALIAQSSLIN